MSIYEILTVSISLIALLTSLATYYWTTKYRGKLEWHFIQHPDSHGEFICIIVNSGQKAITPFGIAAVTTENKLLPLSPNNGEYAIRKLLQPGEILQVSFVRNLKFVAFMRDAKKLVLIDSYSRKFPLDKKEFSNIKEELEPSNA